MRKLISNFYKVIMHFLLGSETIEEKEDHMPTAPIEPEDKPQKDEAPQATMDKPKKDKPHKPKKGVNKMLAVENEYPVREASGVKRTIMDIGDGYFRVNYKAWQTGCVTETAIVHVDSDGKLTVYEYTNYEKE